MRTIKFRIFNKKIKSYIDIYSSAIMIDELNNLNDNLIVEQFTGLHDKNGKDIYDGDVVVRSGVDNCVIEWRADKCKYDFKYKVYLMSSQWMGGVDTYYAQQELEVIGNIHENPELLNN